DVLNSGDYKAQKEWLDTYTPDITPAEEAAFQKSVDMLKTQKEKDAEREAWKATSNAGKRYYMALLGIQVEEGTALRAAPGRLVVNAPAEARVFLFGQETETRIIRTSVLEPGFKYFYDLRVELANAGGESIVQTQRVYVRPGQTSRVTIDPSRGSVALSRPLTALPRPAFVSGGR